VLIINELNKNIMIGSKSTNKNNSDLNPMI
jgi:hypothetical protein